MSHYDVDDEDIALEFANEALRELSEDSRVEGSERDAIGKVRWIVDDFLDGNREP